MFDALLVSMRVTLLAAPAIALVGLAGAVILAHWRSPWRNLLELACILPIVLPPTVTGYYLLNVLGRQALGQFVQLLFTPVGAAIAATVMGLPLMIIAGKAAIAGVDARLEAAARTLGATEWRVLCDVILPLAKRGLIAGFL
ncbi:MAG TPA: ABC transporter permease subunit, partial [bacterium]|nr:ABC transporter permease subunit [bacterium]